MLHVPYVVNDYQLLIGNGPSTQTTGILYALIEDPLARVDRIVSHEP